jgi:NitT/TauT family transport system permease protein
LAFDFGARVITKMSRRLVILLTTLLAWQVAVRGGWVNSIIVPAPTEILRAALTDGQVFIAAFVITITEIAIAVIYAWFFGILSGLLCARSATLSIVAGSVLSSVFAIPIVTLYPLLMAWFGIGMTSKVVFGVLSGYFPIALNTLNGMRAVEPSYLTMARAAGANPFQLYIQVIVPLAMPSILAGLRIGTGLVVIGVLVSEMLASRDGIGYLITTNRTLFNTGHVYLGFIFAIALAVAINYGLSEVERKFRVS